MKTIPAILIFSLVLFTISCERSDTNPGIPATRKVTGLIQKGPYLNGSSVMISELTSGLVQTGKIFYRLWLITTGPLQSRISAFHHHSLN
jgi:hypothetical protein